MPEELIDKLRYSVIVTFLRDGIEKRYVGTFFASSAMVAADTGKDFVIRYLRPQSIIDIKTEIL